LPGYRDTGLYYAQFHSVVAGNRTPEAARPLLPEDALLRSSTEQLFLVSLSDEEFYRRLLDPELKPFIKLVQKQEPFTMGLWSALDRGSIRRTLIHGDTKLENFLFSNKTGRVKSLVDLDTIMPFTWLADYGDMLRSLVNVAGEKERDLSKVVIDREVYEAVSKGFLGAAKNVTQEELDMMVFSVEAITLELGLRFLTDYLRGDTYFQLAGDDPADLNKTRAMVQLTLYQRLAEFEPEAHRRLSNYRVRA
ncbi:MAG TPA: phosphotransferase, partial [Fimbriimonadaceae bacterium]|nr:phosphotransferase [Fimbriimonadaceae bacterium]